MPPHHSDSKYRDQLLIDELRQQITDAKKHVFKQNDQDVEKIKELEKQLEIELAKPEPMEYYAHGKMDPSKTPSSEEKKSIIESLGFANCFLSCMVCAGQVNKWTIYKGVGSNGNNYKK